MKVAILGTTGMLGSMVLDVFAKSDVDVIATCRDYADGQRLYEKYPEVEFRGLNAEDVTADRLARIIEGADWVINCIGIIKPYIHDDNSTEIERAIRVNSLFPNLLARAAKEVRVIQIATDCVYSGQKGYYTETDPQDALDVYGKTKALGEVASDNFYNLRCSIIGPEQKVHASLLDWFLNQPVQSEVNGFTNHQWNGVTTLQFAKICLGIIHNDIKINKFQHIVPQNSITKYGLLTTVAEVFHKDILVSPTEAPIVVDRTLSTNNFDLNNQLWQAAGYSNPPTVEEMITELAGYEKDNN